MLHTNNPIIKHKAGLLSPGKNFSINYRLPSNLADCLGAALPFINPSQGRYTSLESYETLDSMKFGTPHFVLSCAMSVFPR